MNAQRNKTKWRHPLPNSLLKGYEDKIGIPDIIDLETESLLRRFREAHPKVFSGGDAATPVEEIAQSLNVDLTTSNHSKALGTTRSAGAKMRVTINPDTQHYFRRRFTLAHELGHICLSQLAGPLTYHELAQTRDSHHEEEFLCDLFASALLMPRPAIQPYVDGDAAISLSTVNRIARAFKVSKSAVLRRLAGVRKSLLLFWGEIENPLTDGSEKAARITFVYPNLSQLSDHFIPLYCTAHDERFAPNLIAESLDKEISISGDVRIRDLGSLPEANYRVHNIFFRRWSKDLAYSDHVRKTRQLYDMATLIELNPTA